MEGVSAKIQSKMLQKAEASKTRVKQNAERDQHCDSEDLHIAMKGRITMLFNFLSGFLKRKTLDLPSAQPYSRMVSLMYREAQNRHRVFVDKSTDQAALEIDPKWLKAQDDYILRLKPDQLFDLFGYTFNGDVFVNNYLRESFSVPEFMEYLRTFDIAQDVYFALFFPAMRVLKRFSKTPDIIRTIFDHTPSDVEVQNVMAIVAAESNVMKYMSLIAVAAKLSWDRFWKVVIEDYIDSLDTIIRGAPVTPKPMVLYRGVKDDYILKDYKNDKSLCVHVSKSYVSTSASVAVADDFVDYENKCCFIRLHVPAGAQMIMMMGVSSYNEAEFLLRRRTQFYIQKARMEKFCQGTYNLEMRTTNLLLI